MNTPLPGMVVDIEARIDKLEKSLKKANQLQGRSATTMERRARQSADRMRDSYGKAGDAITAKLKKIALPLIGTAALTNLSRSVRTTIADISNLGKVADRIDFDVESLQGLQRGFDLSGVSADTLNASLQEFGKRVGEAATGGGELVAVLDRYNITLTGNDGRMKSQMQLLREFSNAIKSAASDQERLLIADKTFGGGGLEMVNALAGGGGAIDGMINSAREGGFILDEELVRKAEELDDKFADLQRRTGTWFKAFAVGAADAVIGLGEVRNQLAVLLPDANQGRAVLGDQIFDALEIDSDAVDEAARDIERLRAEFTNLDRAARQTAATIFTSSTQVSALGYADTAAELVALASEMQRMSTEFDAGTLDADDFAAGLDGVQASAQSAFDQLDEADKIDFSAAISEIGRFGGAIAGAISLANSLRSAVAGAAGVTVTPGAIGVQQDADRAGSLASQRQASAARAAMDSFNAAEAERNAKTRERLAIEREIEAVRDRAAEAGTILSTAQAEAAAVASIAAEAARAEAAKAAGTKDKDTGGGGAKTVKLDEFATAVEAIKAETAALEVEALALAMSAAAGEEYSRAIDMARQKADLLNAALASGRQDTPALRAEIDALTGSYGDLAASNDAVKDKIDQTRAAQEAFGQIAEGAFVGLITRTMSFREALSSVASQLAQMAASKAFVGLMSGDGTAGKIGRFFGYAEGGFTGPGGKHEPAGIVHKGEFVMSKAATSRLGVGNLQAMHSAALEGYSAGGYVGAALTAPALAAPVQSAPQISISAPISVTGSSGTPDQNRDLAKQMAREMEASMRGVIVSEIQKQSRPGNILGRK